MLCQGGGGLMGSDQGRHVNICKRFIFNSIAYALRLANPLRMQRRITVPVLHWKALSSFGRHAFTVPDQNQISRPRGRRIDGLAVLRSHHVSNQFAQA
jgi:hypothetical protein